jgi:hypothetical protein
MIPPTPQIEVHINSQASQSSPSSPLDEALSDYEKLRSEAVELFLKQESAEEVDKNQKSNNFK